MARYELTDGSSNKFWEIKLDGASFTTTYGKIGASGQTTLKQWKDAGEAKREHDKLVAEKTKKGYALVGNGKPAATAKPAPTPAAKPAAKPAAAAPATGARYFEFSERAAKLAGYPVAVAAGKFWEVRIDGSSVRTRYGKIGTDGLQTVKSYKDAAEATREHDKLIAEKTKMGYALVGAGKPAAAAKAAAPAAKPAPAAKAATPAAKAAPAAPAGGASYYEFSDDSSNKFWEIRMDGNAVRTRYGKIGTDGQQSIKDFADAAAAQKEYDKLVHEKTKKGYELKGPGGGKPGGGSDPRNPELEAAILANPADDAAYAILGDWLQEQGDVRGELIALQLAGKAKEAQKYIDKHADYLLGRLAPHVKTYDGSLSNNNRSNSAAWVRDNQQAFLWHGGYIRRLRLAHDDYAESGFEGKLVDVLKAAFAHPSGRFISELAFNSNGDPNDDDLQDLIDALAKIAPKSVRKIIIGDNIDQISWYNVGNLGKLWAALPNLRELDIEAGSFTLGKVEAPNLERAVFKTGGLARANMKSLAAMVAPKLAHLEIYFGSHNYGADCKIADVKPFLARTDLTNLRYLGLENAEFANDIAAAIAAAKVVAPVTTLNLSQGTMTDEGATALVGAKPALRALQTLDLDQNYLTADGQKAVKGLAKQVSVGKQKTPDNYGDEMHYYVAVSE